MIIVGHRGARAEAPENTVEGFEHAYAKGCRHFELDVQLSSDEELMVFHDRSLKRNTGQRGQLSKRPAKELNGLDARLNTPGWPHACYIPTLEDVIQSCPEVLHWQFEVKSNSRIQLKELSSRLERLIARHSLEERATITSSNRWLLKFVNLNYSRLSTGLVTESRFRNPVKEAKKLGCQYLIPNKQLITADMLAEAQQENMHVSVWTVNETTEADTLKEMGVDSLITDHPSDFLSRYGSVI